MHTSHLAYTDVFDHGHLALELELGLVLETMAPVLAQQGETDRTQLECIDVPWLPKELIGTSTVDGLRWDVESDRCVASSSKTVARGSLSSIQAVDQ